MLHYGQEIFEGLKAYRQPDGSIATFRPEQNARRFARSAHRLAMAELPEELFLASVEALVAPGRGWVPAGARGVAVPAAVHDLDRGRSRGASGELVPVTC